MASRWISACIVIVRHSTVLEESLQYSGAYLQDAERDPDEMNPAEASPELSRPFRGLRMWLPLILLGTKPFSAALDEKLLLAKYFAREVRALGFEVLLEPDLSVVTYRWAPADLSVERANELNQAIIDGVWRDGRVFMSSTMLNDRFTLRMVALSFRTHRRTMDLAITVLREQLRHIGAGVST